jgi:hypothetical protein
VDTIATELVPQLQKHTEQLTNVFTLIDKMHDHLDIVKDSGTLMSPPHIDTVSTIYYCSHPYIDTVSTHIEINGIVRMCVQTC